MEALGNQRESCDRISELPDSVIQHILSFLPVKDVIRTSFLSKRWKYLWTSVPNLDFDGLVFSPKTKFMNFVDSVLLRRNGAAIQKFRLSFGDYYCDGSRVHTWIDAAVTHNVRELDFFYYTSKHFDLPICLYTCKSLTVLKLNLNFATLNLPSSIYLPSLKTLQLSSLAFPNDDLTEKLFSSCPILESLILRDCALGNLKILRICSSSLQRLSIDGLPKELGLSNGTIACQIKVSTPRLLSFEYSDHMGQDISIENMSSLEYAYISFDFDWEENEPLCVHCVTKFLRGLSNAKVLKVSSTSIQLLSPASNSLGRLPMFYNLSRLNLGAAATKENIRVITSFLHSAPNLEILAIAFLSLVSR
uniref:F-box domain-containing protein n=1 Tax=Nelumbo nucifera TaxID=4432 RepID=A0A822XVZ2_NELNU|nr:TPA_asm: hypothetical protein HUJ06_024784 [Nelumbo nucifera]